MCRLPVPQAFLKYAIEAQCPLTFPFPGDNVAVMRAGLLRHISRCGASWRQLAPGCCLRLLDEQLRLALRQAAVAAPAAPPSPCRWWRLACPPLLPPQRHSRYMQLLGLDPGQVVPAVSAGPSRAGGPGAASGDAAAAAAAGDEGAGGAAAEQQQEQKQEQAGQQGAAQGEVKREEGAGASVAAGMEVEDFDWQQQQQQQQQQQVKAEQQQQPQQVKGEQQQQPAGRDSAPASERASAAPAAGAASAAAAAGSQAGAGEAASSAPWAMAAPLPLSAGLLLAPRVQPAQRAALQAHWDGLRARVAALRPVERYSVRSVVYRRHLCDEAQVEHEAADEAAPRWPVAWLILRPAKYGPRH